MCECDCGSERGTRKRAEGGVEGTTVSAPALRIQGLSGLIANRWLKENTKRWLKTKGDPFEDDFSLISLGCLQLMFPADMRMEPQALVFPLITPLPRLQTTPVPQLRGFNGATAPPCGHSLTFLRCQASYQPRGSNADPLIPWAGRSSDGHASLGKCEEERSIQNNKSSQQQHLLIHIARTVNAYSAEMGCVWVLSNEGNTALQKYPSPCGAERPAWFNKCSQSSSQEQPSSVMLTHSTLLL